MTSDQRIKRLKGTSYVIPIDIKPLGKGSFGEVQRIFDTNRKEVDLAVKIIDKKNKNKAAKQEMNNIRKIPFCINLLTCEKIFFESDKSYYLIMEYCNGGDLYSQIKNRRLFSEQEIIEFLAQFINGYLHLLKHGIVHRDVKPQNILIHNNMYKICDFGISKYFDPLPPEDNNSESDEQKFLTFSVLPGTPYFTSPEVNQEQYKSETLDVFSLGIILYQLLFISGSKNQNVASKNHPLFDMTGITDKKAFQQKQKELFSQESNHLLHLEKQIKLSSIKRSKEIIDLLKSMLEVDFSKRITFSDLSQHNLIKNELQLINNSIEQEEERALQILKKVDNIQQMNESHISLFKTINSSEIQNMDILQEEVVKQSVQLCLKMEQQGKIENNSFYVLKRIYLQKYQEQLIAAHKGSNLVSIENKQLSRQTLLGIPLPQIKKNQLITPFQESQTPQEEQLQLGRVISSTESPYEDFWSESKKRILKQTNILKIEQSLLFFIEAFKIYEKVAIQLSQSYSIVSDDQISKLLTKLFDEVSMQSLIIYKQSIQKLIQQEEIISMIKKNKSLIKDLNGFILEEFIQSEVNNIFLSVIHSDIETLDNLTMKLMDSKGQCIQLMQADMEEGILNELLKKYSTQVREIIKLGMEEFGLLKGEKFIQFQRVMLLLTEIHQFALNQEAFFEKYSFTKGNLLFRLEQIFSMGEEIKSSLINYCDQNGILVVTWIDD